MINDSVRQWLLEADLEALEGRGPSEVARLVREDPEVRAAARTITASMRDTDAGLTTIGLHAASRPHAVRRPRASPRSRTRFVVAVLATATIALLLIGRPAMPPVPAPAEQRPMTARLAASSTRPLAVFATDNPDIAIVWLFNEEDR